MTEQERTDTYLIENAAIEWWKNRRPFTFTEGNHLDNPTVNTSGMIEYYLAQAVAQKIRHDYERAGVKP